MFSLFRKKSRRISIKGMQESEDGFDIITASPGETILQAALREGLPLPHNCRVGGCGECKCRLKEGRVKELTESAYVLSSQELQQGYILACQSVPKSDITIQSQKIDSGDS